MQTNPQWESPDTCQFGYYQKIKTSVNEDLEKLNL